MSESDIVFIYALTDRDSEHVHYVGKTLDPERRYKQHLDPHSESANKTRWIGSLMEGGKRPEMVILEKTDTLSWPDVEKYWIAKLRREGHPLTNVQVGRAQPRTGQKPGGKKPSSFRLSSEALSNLKQLERRWRVNKTEVLERLLQDAVDEGREMRMVSRKEPHNAGSNHQENHGQRGSQPGERDG